MRPSTHSAVGAPAQAPGLSSGGETTVCAPASAGSGSPLGVVASMSSPSGCSDALRENFYSQILHYLDLVETVNMALPDFLLAGAPKAGTTALHVALAAHPQVFMSTPKEPKFFLTDDDTRPIARGGPGDAQTIRKQIWRRTEYEALFDAAPPGALRGESTTLYLQDRAAHRRIATTVPSAKIVVVLRDPVDRAHSNWTHLRSAGLEPEADFLRACALDRVRARDGWAPFWGYVTVGRYGEQLEHLFSVFPRDQVLVVFYRDLREHPQSTLDDVCGFLGIETGVISEVPAMNVTAESSPSRLNDTISRLLRH